MALTILMRSILTWTLGSVAAKLGGTTGNSARPSKSSRRAFVLVVLVLWWSSYSAVTLRLKRAPCQLERSMQHV
jgi:hypothetical protein